MSSCARQQIEVDEKNIFCKTSSAKLIGNHYKYGTAVGCHSLVVVIVEE
jgi:hypothetical protein